ncbi:hypothetical protein ACA910_016331 [Epithemia clementina (nom. ined.)]
MRKNIIIDTCIWSEWNLLGGDPNQDLRISHKATALPKRTRGNESKGTSIFVVLFCFNPTTRTTTATTIMILFKAVQFLVMVAMAMPTVEATEGSNLRNTNNNNNNNNNSNNNNAERFYEMVIEPHNQRVLATECKTLVENYLNKDFESWNCPVKSCTSNDLSYNELTLKPVIPDGLECLSACTCGDVLDVYLYSRVTNNGGSDRDTAYVRGRVTFEYLPGSLCENEELPPSCIDGIKVELCQSDLNIQTGEGTDVDFNDPSNIFQWPCGSTATLTSNTDIFTQAVLGATSASDGANCEAPTETRNGCKFLDGPKCRGIGDTVLQPPFSITDTSANCATGAQTGSLSVSVTGGNGPYRYQWFKLPGLTPVGSPVTTTATTNTITNQPEGDYRVTIQDTSSTCSPLSVDLTLEGCCAVAVQCKPPKDLGDFDGCDADDAPGLTPTSYEYEGGDAVFGPPAGESFDTIFNFDSGLNDPCGTLVVAATAAVTRQLCAPGATGNNKFLQVTYTYKLYDNVAPLGILSPSELVKTASGGSVACTQFAEVKDTTPPTVNCGSPNNAPISCNGSLPNGVAADCSGSSDACSAVSVNVNCCFDFSGASPLHKVKYTVSDKCGNSQDFTKTATFTSTCS